VDQKKTRKILGELGFDIFLEESLKIKKKIKLNESTNYQNENESKVGIIYYKRHE